MLVPKNCIVPDKARRCGRWVTGAPTVIDNIVLSLGS